MPWTVIAISLFAAVALVIALVTHNTQSGQSFAPSIPGVEFQGEYRIGDGEWQPLSSAKHISSSRGNVELKGSFYLTDPNTGNTWGEAQPGTVISLYLDHLGATVIDAEGEVWISDNETELLGKGACAEVWTTYSVNSEQRGNMTVILRNPHVFGNGVAVDAFLGGLSIYNGDMKNSVLGNAGPLQILMGLLFIVFFFILLGAALICSVIKVKYSRQIWLAWLLVLFGEVYFVFSSSGISLWSSLYAFNTLILGFSMMLYLLVASTIVASFIYGEMRRVAYTATVAVAVATLSAIIASSFESVRLYDIYPYWTAVAVAACVALSVCLVKGFLVGRGKDGTDPTNEVKRYVYVPSLAFMAAFVGDAVATAFGLWQGGVLSVAVLSLTVALATVVILRVVPVSMRTKLDANELEAERQAMELRLQESRISIMLSQIQPHFLYNTLNSIYQLCETNPMLARSMVNSFSEYLRNNLSSLDEPGLVSFETELSHVKTYLDIEKIRFDDTLEIEYDVRCGGFRVPVLTVQPIVENAVKHGTSKKRGGGKVTISTAEDNDFYIVTVSDSGCGFDPSVPKDDGKRHVGIENVRQRLSNMCSGTLTIESELGKGTVVTIRIPKEDEK